MSILIRADKVSSCSGVTCWEPGLSVQSECLLDDIGELVDNWCPQGHLKTAFMVENLVPDASVLMIFPTPFSNHLQLVAHLSFGFLWMSHPRICLPCTVSNSDLRAGKILFMVMLAHSGNRAVNITEKIIERTKAFFGCKLWGLSSAANVPGKFSCQCPYQRLPDRLLVSGKNWLFTWLNTCTAFFIFNSRPKYFCSVLFHFIALAWHRPFTMI